MAEPSTVLRGLRVPSSEGEGSLARQDTRGQGESTMAWPAMAPKKKPCGPCAHTCTLYHTRMLVEREGGRAGGREKKEEMERERKRERGRERERERDGGRESARASEPERMRVSE